MFAQCTVFCVSAGLAAACTASIAHACPYSIRDSAFIGSYDPPPYRLHIVVPSDFTLRDDLEKGVERAARTWLVDAATTVSIRDAGDAAAQRLAERLPPDALRADRLPAVILESPDERATVIPGLGPDDTSPQAVLRIVESVVSSPARSRLREHAVSAWCVVLMLEGSSPEANDRAARAIRQAAQRITGTTTELGRVVRTPPHLLRVSAGDPHERLFLWSLGLNEPTELEPPVRAVMLVGRSERRGPVWTGDQITADALFEAFVMLGRSCSCTTAESWLTGPMPPLEWGADMLEAVRSELGFDPRDPEALRAIENVVAGIRSPRDVVLDPGLGYRESFFGPDVESHDDAIRVRDVTTVVGDERPPESADAAMTNGPEPDKTTVRIQRTGQTLAAHASTSNRMLFITIASLVLFVTALTVVLLRRAR